MKNRAFAVPVKLLALLIAGVSSGISANEFAARLEASSRYSDNATKASEEQNTIEERQDRYQLELSGLYENALVELGANYVASANIFQKESQDDRNLLEGDSHLRLGKPTQLFDLLLTHSRRSLRTSAEDLDLLANRDERQMLSVIPSFHLGATSADRFLVIGNYTKVDYRFNENRNSEYTGANLVWQHDFSRTDGIELSGQHTEVDFEYFPAVDYQYQAAMFSYHASLRNLSYTLAAGYNQSKRDLDDVENSAPSFRVEVGYDTGVHQLSVYAEQRITDSSVGDGNRGELGMPRPGDVSAGTLDQIKRRSLEVSWNTQALCDRCEMGIYANARKDEFLSSPQNNDEVGGGASFSYRLSPAARISATWNRRDRDFVISNENVKLDRSAIEYRYEFRSGIGLAVFAEHEKSKSNSGQQDYEETIGGLSLSYQY